MAILQYPRHRQYDEQRVDANNAVMALLAGSKLATSVLQLTTGSEHRLAELFPSVEHIERLNLRTDDARLILTDAENHVGAMAIPYVMSIHEDYIVALCQALKDAGVMPASSMEGIGPANMHERLVSTTGGSFTPGTLNLFHFLRLVRNAQIHYAGKTHQALAKFSAAMTAPDEANWMQITSNPLPRYHLGDPLNLSIFELIGTLAVSKRLAEDANEEFQLGLPRAEWIALVVQDWASTRRVGNPEMLIRSAAGFARHAFGPLALTRTEIETELRRIGKV